MSTFFRRILLGQVLIFSFVLSSFGATFVVTSTADSGPGSLREAIGLSNSSPNFGTADDIVFNLPPGSVINLLSPLSINNCCGDYLTILGPGIDLLTINGGGNQIFIIQEVTLQGLTLTGGNGAGGPAAVNVVGSGSAILDAVKVQGNTSPEGAIQMNSSGSLMIYNSLITGNSGANNGAGLKHNGSGSVTILNTTIAFNEALFGGGGIMKSGGSGPMTINNSIIAKNTSTFCCPVDIRNDAGPITFGTNLVGDVDGTSLIADGILLGSTAMPVDPLFVMDAMAPPTISGDFHLQDMSPALNAGVNGNVPPPPFDLTDIEGNPRISESTVDLGAYESLLPPPIVNATETDAEVIGNMDGIADQGETFRYTVTLGNAAMVQDAMMTLFSSGVDINSSLVVGSVTTTQGTITSGNTGGDTSVGVDVGTLASGGSVTITYDVLIDVQNPGIELSCQGTISGSNFNSINTDDPDTGAPDDATLTPLTPPDVSFTKTAMHIDGNGDGKVNMGEIVRYTLMVSNAPNVSTALGVMVDSPVDPNADLVIGSVTTSQGSVTSGNTGGDTDVSVNVGDLNQGSSVTIMFDFEVTFGGTGATLECQATASGSNFMEVLSDDPAEPGDTDPTIIGIPTMGEWGIICLSLLMLIGGLLAFRNKEKFAY